MPFKVFASNRGGNLEQNEITKVENILYSFDERIVHIAQERSFSLKNVRWKCNLKFDAVGAPRQDNVLGLLKKSISGSIHLNYVN